MSDINTRMAAHVVRLLAEHGVDVSLQSRTRASGDFDTSAPTWSDTADVRAIWDSNIGFGAERLKNGGAGSVARQIMYVAYRGDLKATKEAASKRIVCDGVAYNIAASFVIGRNVAIKLLLEDGVPT